MRILARIALIGVALGVCGGAAALATGAGGSTVGAQYYVDGARPAEGTVAHGDDSDDCVPWSSERPDIRICGDLPADWAPGAPRGGIDAYPEVCAATLDMYQFEGELPVPSRTREEIAAGDPTIDPDSCLATPVGTYPGEDRSAPEFSVAFTLKDGSGHVQVMLDTDGEA